MPEVLPGAVPPEDAIRFYRAKGLVRSFAWQDVWQEQHAFAFTVAKLTRDDLLAAVRAGVDRAITEGTTLGQFRRELEPLLQREGWWGRKLVRDPAGEEREVQLGSPRRLQTIYQTNLRTSYAAGKWAQFERLKARRPYLRYVALLDGRTRPLHRQWHDIVLPVDDPWWRTHAPPNGWNCRCTLQSLSERDLGRYNLRVSPAAPPTDIVPWRDPRSGDVIAVPRGIDPGWAYNPGAAPLRGLAPTGELQGVGEALRDTRAFQPAARATIPLPPPRPVEGAVLLPDDLPPAVYAEAFLAEFDIGLEAERMWTDPTGEPVVLSRALFEAGPGQWKSTKRGRGTVIRLLARGLKEPDEIWYGWEADRKIPGRWHLRRRYIARWQLEDSDLQVVTVVEWGKQGWRGVSALRVDLATAEDVAQYLDLQRQGYLAYRRVP